MTTAVLVATDPARGTPGDRAAAGLSLRGGTVLGNLVAHLRALGVERVTVLARPRHAEALRGALPGRLTVEECATLGDELRAVSRLARATAGPLVVLAGDIVAHRQALATLLDHPGVGSGALCSWTDSSRPEGQAGSALPAAAPVAGPRHDAFPGPSLQVEGRRVVSAGSPYHRVSRPNARFHDVLRVAAADVPALVEGAERFATLSDKQAGEPPDEGAGTAVATGARQLGDVPSLLVVGLVRQAVELGACQVTRSLRCERAHDQASAEELDSQLAAVDENRAVLDAAVKSDDGFFTTFCVSSYSKYIAAWAARRGLTPNAVTIGSMALGVVAAVAFAAGTRLGWMAGGVFLYLAFVLDCVDGQLARYTRQFSAFGSWLDATFDRGKEYLAYAGLAVGAAGGAMTGAATGEVAAGALSAWTLAIAAMGLQTVRHMVDFSYSAAAVARGQPSGPLPVRPLDEVGDGQESQPADGTGRRGGSGWASVAVGLLSGHPGGSGSGSPLRWFKKIIVLPIGERFALIALTAAIAGPRVTFYALLGWGALALAYTVTGRVLRSVAR